MKLRTGNMFTDDATDVLLITGNSFVKSGGQLVMGRGAARQLRDLFPGCDRTFGNLIIKVSEQTDTNQNVFKPYGVIYYRLPQEESSDLTLGVFQVKDHWATPAQLSLIRGSVKQLVSLATGVWKRKRISLNFPGIGNGQLDRSTVLPLLKVLPNNVTVWELP